MEHTERCTAAFAAYEEWKMAHPHVCLKCHGFGGKYYPGWFNPAIGGEPPSFDECSACIGAGLCPVCGKQVCDPEDDETWNLIWDDMMDDKPLPCGCNPSESMGEPECYCWLEDDYKYDHLDEGPPMEDDLYDMEED
jgi:hypothetical protein